jgi:serine/threonine-protein kinase RsbW
MAAAAGADGERLDAVKLAVSEALTNVVRHAYNGDGGLIHVSAEVDAGRLSVLIADDGRGLRPHVDEPGMGFGLALIAEATDELAIAKRPSGGTDLRMEFELTSRM